MIPEGSIVKCIRNRGGNVKVGDIGVVVGYNTYTRAYKVKYPKMNYMCTSRGYWLGDKSSIQMVGPVNEEELYY